jgi:hypothetical protein
VIGPAVPTRTVTGSAMVTYVSPGSRVSLPLPSEADLPEALVKDGSGAYVTLPGAWGTGASAGTFTIPDVPVGEYILRLGMSYLVTSTSAPDLGYLIGGRPMSERTPIATWSTLDLSINGLSPWNDRDQIQFVSPQVGQMDVDSQLRAVPLIAPGDVSAVIPMNLRMTNYSSYPPSLIEGSKGDRAYLSQLSFATSAGGSSYWAMSRLGRLPSVDSPVSGRIPVAVALADVSGDHQLALDIRASQWAGALARDGNPKHLPACPADGLFYSCSHNFSLVAKGGRAEDSLFYDTASLDLLLYQDRSPDGSDVQTGVMNYGSPFSATQDPDWGVVFMAYWLMPVMHSLDQSTAAAEVDEQMFWSTYPTTAQAGPVVPPVTPATAITVGGLPFFAGGQGIGLTPKVSWSAPRTGNPGMYAVTIRELLLKTSPPRTASPIRFRIRTPHTSVEIPPGVLAAGKTYVFALNAMVATSPEAAAVADAAPRKSAIDFAWAEVVSEIFIP